MCCESATPDSFGATGALGQTVVSPPSLPPPASFVAGFDVAGLRDRLADTLTKAQDGTRACNDMFAVLVLAAVLSAPVCDICNGGLLQSNTTAGNGTVAGPPCHTSSAPTTPATSSPPPWAYPELTPIALASTTDNNVSYTSTCQEAHDSIRDARPGDAGFQNCSVSQASLVRVRLPLPQP